MKKRKFYGNAKTDTEATKECVQCGVLFKPHDNRQDLCYKCAKDNREDYRQEAKRRKWYKSKE